MKATKVTVAKAPARSSSSTAAANKTSERPDQANQANIRFVTAIRIPDTNMALTRPIRIANSPPINVNTTVVIQPIPFEYSAISDLLKPISL